MSGTFTSEIPLGLPVQFVIDEIQQGVGRLRILSAAPGLQPLGYVFG
jgi:hypothetical protein